ncbi:tRNA (adenosine(37)-N6)-threonylcarbamoyltransferase complex transferase subunit TsaD [Acidithiobacillus marinus]|uniref:tRNA N6-adenosine threonylcarbamoyltransferase n=1 Tax=Acidithiobacillus marinus TaxID=187490 RepID=A0A2I1DMA8_9PROT|nr:tRNA (adenosine(37)-N6)-threonylcarbamoyltransferase complex transferase subunit TsaD [Acidithiobacillus marinus]PKY11002.1 tRNA (adenosine(37)-N6)-threonylcarbamoyltransferase complex transferase subunit TsaD [Acidithiobacillus marinus]
MSEAQITRVLGIESSCDETGLALYDIQKGLLGEVLFSQIALHAPYGGVVPELASRDHVRRLPLLLEELMAQSGGQRPDAVAVTAGPGLIGALLVGVNFARALAYAWDIPVIPVHHLEGHLLAPLLNGVAPFPAVALLVSGGHTMLIEVRGLGDYVLLGETLDDAAGEAFDKAAKMLGLGYPGGPALAALAEGGDPEAFRLPRPLLDRPGMDFSFSGLKTAFRLVSLKVPEEDSVQRSHLAASFQQAVVDTLFRKCQRALQATGLKRLIVAGGVGANRALRDALQSLTADGVELCIADLAHCTDNAAMIALAGALHPEMAQPASAEFPVRARWSLVKEET